MLKIFKRESLLKDWTVDNISFRLCFSTKKKDIKCTCKSGENTYTKVLIIQKVYYKIGGFTKKPRKQFIADIEYIIGGSTKWMICSVCIQSQKAGESTRKINISS